MTEKGGTVERGGWTYIMTNRPRGVLYIGVTAHLAQRVDQNRRGEGSAFCRRYGIDRLVLAEPHEEIAYAIAREKPLKAWRRAWKIELIEATNPTWRDLFLELA
jgi:putative endonuclease